MSENVATEEVVETGTPAQTAAEQAKDVAAASAGGTPRETEAGTASEGQKTEIRRLKLVVGGKEEELSERDAAALIQEARQAKQIKNEGYKKFEEAANLRKQFLGIKDIIHQDPESGMLEMAKLFGLPDDTLERIYARRQHFEKQWADMNEDQRARWIAERKTAELQGEKAQREEQAKAEQAQQEYQNKLVHEEKRLATETLPAMQRAGLPTTHLTVKMVAATLGALADRDPDSPPNIDEAVEYVARVWHEQTSGYITGFEKDPGAFVTRYPAVSEALRKHYVAQATGKPPGIGKAPVSQGNPPPKVEEESRQTWSEFSQQIRALQRGTP